MNQLQHHHWLAATDRGVTGIDFLDACLPQNAPPAQVIGLLGPIGVGKSTLGAMIAVEGAKIQLARRLAGGAWGTWAFVNLDGAEYDMWERITSHGAQLSRTRSSPREAWNRPQEGWRETNRPYEIERAAELPQRDGVPLPEYERLADFHRHLFGSSLQLVHLANRDFGPLRSLIAPIVAALESLACNGRIAGVVIDYVGMATRTLPGDDPRHRSGQIQQFVRDCRQLIASRWDCPVWLIHQLNGRANGRRSGAIQHHSDARDCKRFGDELDACFVLGKPDPETSALLLHCTKPHSDPPAATILRFDEDFATLRPADGLGVDQVRERIVPRRNPIYIDPSFFGTD